MHTQLFRCIDRDTQPVIVEHFFEANPGLDTTDANGLPGLNIFQRKQVQGRFRRTALIEGFTGAINLALKQFPVGGQCGQAFAGLLRHGIEVFQIVRLKRADHQHLTPSPVFACS